MGRSFFQEQLAQVHKLHRYTKQHILFTPRLFLICIIAISHRLFFSGQRRKKRITGNEMCHYRVRKLKWEALWKRFWEEGRKMKASVLYHKWYISVNPSRMKENICKMLLLPKRWRVKASSLERRNTVTWYSSSAIKRKQLFLS